MRRSSWLVAVLIAIVGCKGGAFTAHPDVAAEAAGQTLSAERVAEILTSVKGVQVNPEAATFVAQLWTDYTLFAQAVATNTLEADSAMVAGAMWKDVAEFTAGHWFDSLIAERATMTPAHIDSVYALDSVRVFQHVLVTVEPTATEAARNAARRKAEGVLADARRGTSFGALALRHSDEPAAQADSGFLPVSPRGAFVASFDSAAWLLQPGAVSGVVVTSYGFHVIRRADDAQAKARLGPWLEPQLVQRMEMAYYAELDSTYQLEIARNATVLAKEALADLNRAGKSTRKLVSFSDGEFTVADFARWIRADVSDPVQGPQQLAQLQQIPDSQLRLGLEQMGQRYLFLREAERHDVRLTPEEWAMINEHFVAQVDSLKSSIGLTPAVIDPNAPEEDRRRAAALRVDGFFDRMTSGESRMRLLPGMLAWTLRDRGEGRVNPAGVQHAVSLAQARLTGGDTTGATAGGDTATGPAPIRPAPGGPPVGDPGAP
jgi:hypothetical protein